MKRIALFAGVLSLGLGACTQNGGVNIGQGFSVDANVVGGAVEVAVTRTTTPSGGTTVSTLATTTQPTITFNARPQSVGFQLQKYTVEILDNAGVRYAEDQGLYQLSASAIIQPGFVCSTADAATPVEQCAPSAKTAANVSTPVSGLTLIDGAVSRQIASDCASIGCPTLKMKVTFMGVDDSGRAQSIVVAGADLGTRVTSSN